MIEYTVPLMIDVDEKDAERLDALQTRFHCLLCIRIVEKNAYNLNDKGNSITSFLGKVMTAFRREIHATC